MKIAIDARAFFWTGVGRYVRNLLREYALAGREVTVLVSDTETTQVREILKQWRVAWPLVPVEGSYYSWREQVLFYRQLQKLEVDLVHFVHFNVPLLYRRPYVVTIHDVTRFFWPAQVHPTLFRQMAYETVLAGAVTRAKAIVCVSEATKRELLELPLKIRGEMRVIREGVEPVFSEPVASDYRQRWRELLGWQGKYLLYVGVWMNHKNLWRLLLAFRAVSKDHPEVKLVLTGEYKDGYVDVARLVKDLDLEGKVLLPGFVAGELLPAVYAEAMALVFASLYEGFGLPLLEAAAAGCPIVTSNVSSMPEVLGEAALYVNPDSVESIAAGIRRVVEDSALRETLSHAGRTRTTDFRWGDSSGEMWQVYKSAIR